MSTYVAMLRGINVGGQQKMSMADLRALFVGLGHTDVATYIQSGNVIFTSRSNKASSLARASEEQIADRLGLAVTVLLRTRDQLGEVIDGNRFIRRGVDPAKLHVTFLAGALDAARPTDIAAHGFKPDEFMTGRHEVYLHCPNGYGRTKLNNAFWERRLGLQATTRNWNTVVKLFELAST